MTQGICFEMAFAEGLDLDMIFSVLGGCMFFKPNLDTMLFCRCSVLEFSFYSAHILKISLSWVL